MPLRRSIAALIVALIGILLCAGNLWFTAERSTIPISIDAVLADREIGREKHPGSDDVHWLIFENGERLHVDESVFNALNEGERIYKAAWSKELRHGENIHLLKWSPDFHGMLWTMAGGMGVIITLIVIVGKAVGRRT